MQLDLAFLDRPDLPPNPSPTVRSATAWEQLDEATRIALRPRFARSPVASANRSRGIGDASRFPSSLSAVGANSTPCGIRPPGLAGFPGG